MRERQVLWVTVVDEDGNDQSQHLMLSEVRYINAMLKDGLIVKGVKLETVTEEYYKFLFGR